MATDKSAPIPKITKNTKRVLPKYGWTNEAALISCTDWLTIVMANETNNKINTVTSKFKYGFLSIIPPGNDDISNHYFY